MKVENTYKDWFASLLGSAAMTYAGYGWHMDWITSKEAGIVAFIGFVLLFLRTRLTQVISDGLGKVFEAVMRKIFGNNGGPPPAPTAIILLMCLAISSISFAQNKPINAWEVRLLNKTDSTLISGVGQVRWDAVTGKFRFGNGTNWFSYETVANANTKFWKTSGTTIITTPTITGNPTFNGIISINGSNTNSTLRVGTIEAQGFGLNNSWFGENVYFNGTNFKNRATGSAGLFYFQGNEGQFRFYASNPANTTLATTAPTQLKINSNGAVALGGAISPSGGVFTGASLLLASTGITQDNTKTQMLTKDATTNQVFWRDVSTITGTSDTDILSFEQDDWFYSALISTGWNGSSSGTGAGTGSSATDSFGEDATENAIGTFFVNTGTTSTGSSAVNRYYTRLGRGNTIILRMRMAVGVLSDATDTYTVTAGYRSATAGAFFRYTHSVNAGKYQCVTSTASTETTTDSGVTVDTQFHILEMRISPTLANVEFYIDGVLRATNTTNLPTTSDMVPWQWQITKSAGTADRKFYIDWHDHRITRTTSR